MTTRSIAQVQGFGADLGQASFTERKKVGCCGAGLRIRGQMSIDDESIPSAVERKATDMSNMMRKQ